MAGAVGIVFGLCVLSFTLGAALMYALVRRREDAAAPEPATAQAPDERTWVNKPVAVEPVDDDYDSRPIHRNPVMGLRQMEPALAALSEPVVMPKPVEAVAEERLAEPVAEERLAEPVAKEQPVEPVTVPAAEPVAAVEPVAEPVVEPDSVAEPEAEAEPVEEPEPEPAPPVVRTALPPPASPQPAEHTTWVEREDFRQRYLRTFEEVRRKAGSN